MYHPWLDFHVNYKPLIITGISLEDLKSKLK